MSSFRYEKLATKEVHIFGKDYECREPTLHEQMQYEKGLANKNSDETIDHLLDFLASLGIPREATSKMSKDGILSLLKFLTSNENDISKKK